MNRLVPLFCVLLFASACAQIFDSLPGANEDERIDNIRRAVAQTRAYVAGQACFTEFFPSPADAAAIERWAAWLCSYLGGPAGTNANCTWFVQPGSNSTIVTDHDDLELELILKHTAPISTEMATLFSQLLSTALVGTGSSSLVVDDVVEALANITDALIVPASADAGCREADTTIQWALPASNHIDSVVLNGMVTWNWADALEHAIKVNAGEGAVLVGFGSNDDSLTRTTACLVASAAFPDGGTPCNLAGGSTFAYSHIFPAADTIGYHCAVHATLTGTLTVGTGGTNTGTNTNTAPADITDTADGGNDGDGSAAMRIQSWM